MLRLLYVLLAAGTALSDSTTETVLDSYNVEAHTFRKNKVLRVKGSVRATATNSTDTLTLKVRVGSETKTGTVVIDSGAIDVADEDIFVFELDLIARDDPGEDVDIVARSLYGGPDAAGSNAKIGHEIIANEETDADVLIEVTGTWSVANAGNSCQMESLEVYEVTG